MKNLHIENSYNIWSAKKMRKKIDEIALKEYGEFESIENLFGRKYVSMYFEWWLHNIAYYITKPFCFIGFIRKINSRSKDVDLEEWGV